MGWLARRLGWFSFIGGVLFGIGASFWLIEAPRQNHPSWAAEARSGPASSSEVGGMGAGVPGGVSAKASLDPARDREAALQRMRRLLNAPLLFVKRHSYTGIHIYDTYYKWPPGGGGIYILENPWAPEDQWRIRAVIDPTTPETLGEGVYSHPELSWDAKRLLFCFKGEPNGSTSIYEIGVDGRGLRRLTDPSPYCNCHQGSGGGQHDLAPAYLPDGRIVFLSTRPSGLVPCNNTGVAILHVMNPDGSDIHPISVNNVNEFDPSILSDGRILFGRWEYIDKNALTIQSLWTCNPDGTQETALFANNMVFPEAILDAREVPGTGLIVGTFAKHNAPPRGSIALIDPRLGKNGPQAIFHLEHPEDPTFDRGDSCEPWPVTEDVFLFSGRPPGEKRNVIEMIDRRGHRFVLLRDPNICLHSPMLVRPRPVPKVIPDQVNRQARTGYFFLQDIYQGLPGVRRGEVRWLRVIEETSRTSRSTMGGSPYNQTFLVSAALAFSVKNILGVVPVEADGSAYFEVPSGRAVYFQALDAEGRLIQSMRTFVQAAPGVTRSCIGCHEYKSSTPANRQPPKVLGRQPIPLQPESWGSGFIDYPRMIQPILDRHCVRCHGGPEGIAGGMDLSGGWTEHFNISYENLVSRRKTQLIAHWIAGIDCMNGTALWSSRIFGPRAHGSGAAPLAQLLLEGHQGRIPNLTRSERDLLLAWIDTNGLYHGTWDYNENGCAIPHWKHTQQALIAVMREAGCLRCHGQAEEPFYFENDWINLAQPEWSRILRAPLPPNAPGYGLGLCRNRPVDPRRQRLHLLRGGYAHAVQPPEAFPEHPIIPYDPSGEPVVSFASTEDKFYQQMLAIIRQARDEALEKPRIDMPGAERIAGTWRQFIPPEPPEIAPPLQAELGPDGMVHLRWERSARTLGLRSQLHRSQQPQFTPSEKTLLVETALFEYTDRLVPEGDWTYALILFSEEGKSRPSYISIHVPAPTTPPQPENLRTIPDPSGVVQLGWKPLPVGQVAGYHVYRRKVNSPAEFQRITPQPIRRNAFRDLSAEPDVPYQYHVRSVSWRGLESLPSLPVEAASRWIREPVFFTPWNNTPDGRLQDGSVLKARVHGKVNINAFSADFRPGGYLAWEPRPEWTLQQPLSLECWVWLQTPGQMSVLVSAGQWRQAGWFLQRIGSGWRWHVGGVDCDGGQSATGQWIHLAAVFDGRCLRLYQNGQLVAEKSEPVQTAIWRGPLLVGNYSGGAGPPYQLDGYLQGLRLYHRPLLAEEIQQHVQQKPTPPETPSTKPASTPGP